MLCIGGVHSEPRFPIIWPLQSCETLKSKTNDILSIPLTLVLHGPDASIHQPTLCLSVCGPPAPHGSPR